jgi:hypothetical protein
LWLHIWTPACHDLTVERNFVKADRIRCEGTRCRIADTVVESDAPPWSAEAQAIIESAGLEPAYEDIRGQTETD